MVKGVTVPECGLIGGLRNFAIVLMINLVLGFWGVCMWVNYQSTQPAAKDLSKVNTEQRYFYLGLLGTSGFFIFLNNIVVKYNSDNYCRSTDNYNILYEYVES